MRATTSPPWSGTPSTPRPTTPSTSPGDTRTYSCTRRTRPRSALGAFRAPPSPTLRTTTLTTTRVAPGRRPQSTRRAAPPPTPHDYVPEWLNVDVPAGPVPPVHA